MPAKRDPLRDVSTALEALLPPRAGFSYVPHKPHPRQQTFLDLTCREALFGGAAGGGKSDALLMAALQHVHVPGYAALLLRRTYQDLSLPGAIMDRAQQWLANSGAKWDEEAKEFRFNGGGRLCFGYLQVDKDRFRYSSAEFQFIGFDELTQFPERWYRFLFSRLRKPQRGPLAAVPLRMRGATNPGNIGHEWVRKRFMLDPLDPETGEERVFVPSLLSDNPSLDAATYRQALAQLDRHTRRQLEEGVWAPDTSGLVYKYSPDVNDARDVPKLQRYVLGIDYGFKDSCAFVELGWSGRRVFITRVHREEKMTPDDAASFVQSWMAQRQYDRIVGDMGGLGKGYAEEARKRWGIPVEPAQKVNKRGYISLFNGALERGDILVCKGCEDLTAEWAELPWNEERSDYQDGFLDHLSDAALYGWREAQGWSNVEEAGCEEPHEVKRQRAEERELEEKYLVRRTGGRNAWVRELSARVSR